MHVNVHVHVCIHQRAIAVSREACYWLKSFLNNGSIFLPTYIQICMHEANAYV